MKITLSKHMQKLERRYGGLRKAAYAMGICPAYWSRLRNGKMARPSADTLDRLGVARVVDIVCEVSD